MNTVSSDVAWQIEAGKELEKKDPYDIYCYHKLFFDRLSDLQHMLINHGYDLSLVGGRLLNAYRDRGVIIPVDRLFTVFMMQYDGIWDGSELNSFWGLICGFVKEDDFLYFKPRAASLPPYPPIEEAGFQCVISKIVSTRIGPQGEGLKANVGIRGFDGFPTHNFDINRVVPANEVVLQKFPNLRDSIVLSGQGSSFDKDGEPLLYRLHHSCRKKWLEKRSLVFLYGSPFWTMDEDYIESYFDIRFGLDWNIPVTDDIEWRKKERKELLMK